jgi:hypothetical protein
MPLSRDGERARCFDQLPLRRRTLVVREPGEHQGRDRRERHDKQQHQPDQPVADGNSSHAERLFLRTSSPGAERECCVVNEPFGLGGR